MFDAPRGFDFFLFSAPPPRSSSVLDQPGSNVFIKDTAPDAEYYNKYGVVLGPAIGDDKEGRLQVLYQNESGLLTIVDCLPDMLEVSNHNFYCFVIEMKSFDSGHE